VSDILVRNLSLDGDDNALRIKSNPSRGGLVERVLYDDICVRDSKNPILLNTDYNNPGPAVDRLPVYKDIVLRNVRISGGGKITLGGLDAAHRVGVQFDGTMLDSPNGYKFVVAHADITLGPGPVNFPALKGEDSTVRGTLGKGSLAPCDAMFVPFPKE
jgi:polygalacturonase